MTNANPIYVYFGHLRELIRHAEAMECGQPTYLNDDQTSSGKIYEKQALENIIGEMGCLINECERRIRYLETILAEDI